MDEDCTVNLRRLYLETDELLLREVFTWQQNAPQWFQQMDSVFGPRDVCDFLKAIAEPGVILIGIFQRVGFRFIGHDFIGLIIVAEAGEDVFNSHLCAKRGASPKTLAHAAAQVVNDFIAMGMKQGFCWVAEKNRAVRRLCSTIGFQHEGIVMYKGTYRGRVIKWLRYSIKAEAKESAVAA
jgi:hypothetical protein